MKILRIYIAGFGLFLLVLELINGIKKKTIIKEGYSTVGLVTGYENLFRRVAGAWRSLDYPLVEYRDRNNELQTGYINYAKSPGRYFSVGQKVDIIIHDGKIYFKGALNSKRFLYMSLIIILIGIAKELYDKVFA